MTGGELRVLQLTPEDLEKVRTKNAANLIRRAQEGKPLTRAQQAELEALASGGRMPGDTSSAYVKTQDELGQALGITRRTITACLERYKDATPPVPRTRADGRYDVAAWSAFVKAHNVARKGEGEEDEDAGGEPGQPRTQAQWKARELELKCARLETELALSQGKLLEAGDLEQQLGQTLSAFRTALNNLPGRAADKLIGLEDYHEIKSVLDREIRGVLQVLHGCAWLAETKTPTDADRHDMCHVEHFRDLKESVEQDPEPEPLKPEKPAGPAKKRGKGKIRPASTASVATQRRSGAGKGNTPEKASPPQKAAKRKTGKKAKRA